MRKVYSSSQLTPPKKNRERSGRRDTNQVKSPNLPIIALAVASALFPKFNFGFGRVALRGRSQQRKKINKKKKKGKKEKVQEMCMH
jgi:hypothetical protein